MRRKALVLGAIAVMVLGAAGFASAGPWGFWPGRGCSLEDVPANIEAIRNLNLTDDQVETIQGILGQSSAGWELQDAVRQKMLELRQLYWQKDPDQPAIEAKIEEIEALRQQMLELRQEVRHIKDVLTPEQRESLKEFRATMRRPFGRLGPIRGRRADGGTQSRPPAGTTR